ncbi:MAG: ChaN family lipoprotein, partial [Gemmatimonadota bacterium]|nr:ChaN family lipoprotein [Gemmatimonadota bacterium]
MVERDGVAFTGQAIPDPVLDRLAANRVVLLGETHHLREHYEFVAALLRALHARGFRQLLV